MPNGGGNGGNGVDPSGDTDDEVVTPADDDGAVPASGDGDAGNNPSTSNCHLSINQQMTAFMHEDYDFNVPSGATGYSDSISVGASS